MYLYLTQKPLSRHIWAYALNGSKSHAMYSLSNLQRHLLKLFQKLAPKIRRSRMQNFTGKIPTSLTSSFGASFGASFGKYNWRWDRLCTTLLVCLIRILSSCFWFKSKVLIQEQSTDPRAKYCPDMSDCKMQRTLLIDLLSYPRLEKHGLSHILA